MVNKKKILGAAIGNCVHVSGLYHFLKLAEKEGYSTILLGPAIPPKQIVENIKKHNPEIVALGYRLTPNVGVSLVRELMTLLNENKIKNIKFIFGGTPPVAEALRELNFFNKIFNGKESVKEIIEYLRGTTGKGKKFKFPDTLLERISMKYPYPLLRHHFGRPDLLETIEGVKKIAESEVLDIISLGTDQNAQEHFFHPEDMLKELEGAGGVPVRKSNDLMEIYKASRCGNFPLMRCYSGTRDLLSWAKMSVETINNAWAAIPLCWYSVIDGRSKRSLYDAISENQSVMKWYAEKNIPVEVNESHQWSLRDAHDSLAVTMAFLAAYNAKKVGVKNYVAQYMFNTPPGTSVKMDVAKMLAKLKLIESLEDKNFKAYREVRAGIAHFSSIPAEAKGQLSASAVISLAMQPHILHVVGFSEGDHACYPEELIESCNIIHGVLQNCLYDLPDFSSDKQIINRRDELIEEAKVLLDSIKIFGKDTSEDPWSDPKVLSASIKNGILDAPHFRGNPNLCGRITTRLINGAWYAVDESGLILKESKRTKKIFNEINKLR
jgi:methylmalonyl-CoA mutase cobalamin-binding subunit